MNRTNDYRAKARGYVAMAAAEADPVHRQEYLWWAAAFDTVARLKEDWRQQSFAELEQHGWLSRIRRVDQRITG
jgi:hypothetical protein